MHMFFFERWERGERGRKDSEGRKGRSCGGGRDGGKSEVGTRDSFGGCTVWMEGWMDRKNLWGGSGKFIHVFF